MTNESTTIVIIILDTRNQWCPVGEVAGGDN